MDVYVYQAALWCKDCGRAIRKRLKAEGKAPEDPDDEGSYDSGDYPKGPYPDGGGDADSPQYCGAGEDCINADEAWRGGKMTKVGAFLENPLTEDGYEYVREAVERHRETGEGLVAEEWAEFYDITIDD